MATVNILNKEKTEVLKMSGKLCTGTSPVSGGASVLSQSKAYCEGMNHRAGGTGAERPQTDNPHLTNSPDYISWFAGWSLADSYAGGFVTREHCGCCANPGAITV